MTNPTPHGQVPEALRLADELEIPIEGYPEATELERNAAAELRRLHAYCQELESQVIRDCMTHVQNPAENEHVAGNVLKNGAEVNMNVYAELPEPDATTVGLGAVWNRHSMRDFADATHALRTQQPAPATQQAPQQPAPAGAIPKAAQIEAVWGAMDCPAPATQQAPQQPCPTCAALARTVMCDQVSFDRKPDCYGIRQITEDEGVEEWEDIRTSPDVAREEANDMMATGRGEIYEVVPLWTTPQPSPTAQAAPAWASRFADVIAVQRSEAEADASDAYMVGMYNGMSMMDANYRNIADWEPMLTAPWPCPTPSAQAAESVTAAATESYVQPVPDKCDRIVWRGHYYHLPPAQAADNVPTPPPPPECETEAEKRAFAFGWFKAQEAERMKAESVLEESERLDFMIEQRAYVVSDPDACPGYWLHFVHKETGKCWVQADEHPTPRAAIDAARKQGANHD